MSDRSTFRRDLARQLRVDSIKAADAAGSGHPTSSMSAAELVAVLLDGHLRFDFDDARRPDNDHLVFSKGHASPLLYAAYRAAGAISEDDLLSFRKLGSKFEGHPTPVLPWVDVATGSLGQGLPIGVGLALAARKLDRVDSRIWVLCGDSELAEGSIWEAFDHAAFAELDNLTAIIDVNRLGQRGETMHGWDLDAYADRARAFGWHAITIDGHDVDEVEEAYATAAATKERPTAIIARTKKGKGVAAVEDLPDKHGKPLTDAAGAIAELGGDAGISVSVAKPEGRADAHRFGIPGGELPHYAIGDKVATRRAYGDALKALGDRRGDVVVLDGEVSNSTYAEIFRDAHPERFFEMYIAEQQMAAAAVGIQRRGWVAFCSSFAAFLTRAADFFRMAAVSRANVRVCGSHAGVSIGEDGPSQMGLEDLAMFRAIHGSTVLYPCDPNQTAKLVEAMADREGIVYMRTTRGASPAIYDAADGFEIGGSHIAREGSAVTLIAAGITLHESLAAAEALAAEGIEARVIDAYSIKPIDANAVVAGANETGGIVIAEDHWPEGGLGEAVITTLALNGVSAPINHLAVRIMPGSGTPAELIHQAGIDADAIAAAARDLLAG